MLFPLRHSSTQLSEDQGRRFHAELSKMYVPIAGGKLKQITAGHFIPNTECGILNQDRTGSMVVSGNFNGSAPRRDAFTIVGF